MSRFGILFFLFLLILSQSSKAQDFIGWPNFNPAPDTIKNPETDTEAADRPKKAPLLHKQIDWQPWKDMSMYRYRTGSRYVGRKNWEHYIIFESRENVRFSEISYGPMKASDVLLSSSAPVAKIVLPRIGNGTLPYILRQKNRNAISALSPNVSQLALRYLVSRHSDHAR
jgi:hypothetical protein